MYRVWLRWVALPEFARDECLSCQSQPSLFRAKESPLKKEIRKRTTCVLKSCFLLAGSLLNGHMSWRKNTIFCFHLTKGFGCSLEKSRHAGRDGGHGGAADDCSSDVAAGRRRMALETVTRASLKIVHFWASANSSGTKYFWIRVIGGQKCCCFNFGF